MSDENDAQPEELGGNARKELEAVIGRIESLNTEKAQVSERIKSEYAAAAASGFDKKALKQIIKERANADIDKTVKHRRLVELYRRALARSGQATFGDWARGWIARDAKEGLGPAAGATDSKLDEFLKGRKRSGETGAPGAAGN